MSTGRNVQSGQTDRGRYLARGLGYTNSAVAGMHHEPEPLSEADQADVTRAAAERVQDARRHEWRLALERTERSRAHHESQMRHCERQLARLQRKLAAG